MATLPIDTLAVAPGAEPSGGGSVALVVGVGILVVVLLVGLAAIRRQRRDGRRSKFPPIG